MISPLLRRYTWNSAWLYNVRIFIALCGTTLFPWWIGEVKLTIPLTLGVVAAALTDLDDRLTGRLRNLAITLVCFFIASASVELLFPWPPLFALGLTVSTIGFILLGGLGQRYATIAFGALLIAIYTMLGVTLYDHWYLQPLFLLAGAVWYNLLTLSGHLIFPIRPLQDNLARSYEQLARYLELKSRLFDPDLEDESQAPLYDLALANGQLVATLNQTKVSLLTRLRGDRGQRGTRRTLQYYFVAQDIHERASSSHIQYQTLRDQFRYSDVMFRFQRMLSMQAQACQKLSRAILLREPYQHDAHFERAFMHLDAALDRVRASGASDEQINALGFLLNNLRAIDAQLATIESVQTTAPAGSNTETLLADDRLGGLNDIWLRLRRNMSPESALFRHAVRMSLVLCAGYAFIQFTGLQHGYWILLTSLFVCQPNYNATRHRLALRIIGTLVGVAIGLPVLLLVPSIEGQLVLIVLTGVLFFAFRNVQYAHATMFITLLVLLCFNLLGEGFEVALPRIIDTLIGCAIAWAAVSFIWPDWKFRNLPRVLDRAMNANCRYLDAILEQYHQGRDNRLAYRVARRDAYNRDAELASVVSNLSTE
ncbi:YccS family putative transporter, partial [Klebsiella variicola]